MCYVEKDAVGMIGTPESVRQVVTMVDLGWKSVEKGIVQTEGGINPNF